MTNHPQGPTNDRPGAFGPQPGASGPPPGQYAPQQPGPYPQQPGSHPQQGGFYPPQSAAYAPQGQAYGQPPKKKSKLPLILGIAGGVVVLGLAGVIALVMFVMRAPTLPAGRLEAIYAAPGVQVGSAALTKAKKSASGFSGSDACVKRLDAATKASAELVEADDAATKSLAAAMTGRTDDAKATDKIFDEVSAVAKDCTGSTVTLKEKGANLGTSNGVTFRQFKITQPKATQKELDMVVLKYGNTWSIVMATPGTFVEAKDIAKSYGERVKAAAE